MITPPVPTLLIVEEEPLLSEDALGFLNKMGWKTRHVSKQENLHEICTKENPNIILVGLPIDEAFLGSDNNEKKPWARVVVVAPNLKPIEIERLLKQGIAYVVTSTEEIASFSSALLDIASLPQYPKEPIGPKRVRIYYSTKKAIKEKIVPPLLDEVFAAGCVDYLTKLRLNLAFDEAITNAIEHGNLELYSEWKEIESSEGCDLFSAKKRERLEDPDYTTRLIFVESEIDASHIRFTVRDEGPGFLCPFLDQDTKTFGNLISPYGRGIAIIRGMMDEVTFQEKGREIAMIKRF